VATFPAIWRCALTKREVELENKGALMMEQYFVVESVRRWFENHETMGETTIFWGLSISMPNTL
jgi:hypothetical protein